MFACAMLLLLSAGRAHAQDIKEPIRGLVSMGAYKFVSIGGEPDNTLAPLDAKAGIFGGLVVVATWNQLQPTADLLISPGNAIDQALAQVRAYNKRNPQKPLAVRLRVWGGFEAPDWAKSLGGPPIQTVHNGKARTVGRFWSPAYRQAWAHLQELLAARYDRRVLIREVSVTACMSYTAEPFFIPVTTDDDVLNPLLAAGFTDKAYKRCLSNAIDDYAPWRRSRLVLAVNPLRTAPGPGPGDAAFTKRVMRNCREAIGVRCVFDNHDLDTALLPPALPLYRFMKRQGPEVVFQTFRETPTDFAGTIKLGVRYGASAIELWQDFGGFPLVPNAKLRRWAEWVESNPADPGAAATFPRR
jgi:hypothetical protein